MDISHHLIEKARIIEKQVYHPLLRTLRRHIMNKMGFRLTYGLRNGRVNTDCSGLQIGIFHGQTQMVFALVSYPASRLQCTRLQNIHSVTEESIALSTAESILKKLEKTLESRKTEVIIEIVRVYNAGLSRFLYAFSNFEKNVEYDAENDTYESGFLCLGMRWSIYYLRSVFWVNVFGSPRANI